ncbi:MAG: PAS domain-containing protein, partial [Acidimicrobiales bacterium]
MAESSGLPVRLESGSEPLGADGLRALVESVGDVIALVSEDGTLRYVSSSITACAGYRPEEVIGLRLSDVLESGERRGFAAEILSRPG